jgi:hypothetical protein
MTPDIQRCNEMQLGSSFEFLITNR